MPRARSSSKGQSRSGGETGHAPLHISVGEKQGVPLPDPPSSPQVELADVLEDRERPRNLRSTVSAVISSSSTPTSNQTTGPGDDPPVTSQHQLRNVGSDSNMSFGPHGTTSSSLTNMSSHSTATLSAVAAAGGRQFSSRSKHTGISSAVSSRRPSAATLNQPPTGPVPAVPNLPTSSGYMLSQPSQGKMRVRNTPHLHNTNAEPVSPSLMYWSRAPVHGMLPTRNMRAHSVNLIGDVVWLFGGCDDKGCWRDIWCFDVETFQWTHPEMIGAMPPPCRAHTSTLVDRKLIVFGGGEGPTYYNQLYILDTVTYRWTHPDIKGELPPPRRAHTAVFYRSCLYVFGGGNGQAALNDLWRLDLSIPIDRWEWVEIKQRSPNAPIPEARGYHTANLIGSVMVIMGGSDGKECFDDVWALDLDSFTWRELRPDGKYRRLSHSSTQIGSYLFVIGGHDGTKYLHDILLFNLVSSQFEPRNVAGRPPPSRGYHVCVLADSRLFLFGGFDGHTVFDDVWLLDLAASAYLPQVTSFSLHYSDEDDDTVEGVPI